MPKSSSKIGSPLNEIILNLKIHFSPMVKWAISFGTLESVISSRSKRLLQRQNQGLFFKLCTLWIKYHSTIELSFIASWTWSKTLEEYTKFSSLSLGFYFAKLASKVFIWNLSKDCFSSNLHRRNVTLWNLIWVKENRSIEVWRNTFIMEQQTKSRIKIMWIKYWKNTKLLKFLLLSP